MLEYKIRKNIQCKIIYAYLGYVYDLTELYIYIIFYVKN